MNSAQPSNSNSMHADRARTEYEMKKSMENTIQDMVDSLPENTKKAYNPKIQEFRQWCDVKFNYESIEERYIVSGPKAHFFLSEAVVGRNSRSKRKRNANEEELPPRKIKFSTLDQYAAALVHLWQFQNRRKINSHPPPRQDFMPLLERIKREEEEVKRSNFEDRGVGTIMDGYTTIDQLASITAFYFNEGTTKDLRNSVSFLLSHFCLLRGESARKAELPDLQVVNLDDEGQGSCPAMVLVMRQGKVNKWGRLEIGACLRNTRVEICPFMMLGAYSFTRFHIEREPFPSFQQSRDWFNIKVLKHKSEPKAEWTYHSHLAAVDKAFKACRITSSKKTHVSRGAAARMADLQGVQESDIRRMGRWNNSTMNGAYLTGLPRGIMRSLAGFPQQGTFFLPRNTAVPSESLQSKVFPEATEWLSKIHEGRAEQTVSAEGFLKLLLTLRVTFLQDSVFMQKLCPNHFLWKHELFRDAEYLQFKRDLEVSSAAEENEETITLRRLLPVVERKLANIEDQHRLSYEQLAQKMEQLMVSISDIATGRAPLQINIDWPHGNTQQPRVHAASPRVHASDASALVSDGNEHGADQPLIVSNSIVSNSGNQNPVTSPSSNYRLSRSIFTVTDLYREWTVGLGGGFSVQYMNENHPGWYKNQKSFYMRRRRIIKACEDYSAAEGVTLEDAVRRAEMLRARNGKSLDYLSKNPDIIFTLL